MWSPSSGMGIGIMVTGMASQIMMVLKKYKIMSPFQPPHFDSFPLDDEQHHDKLSKAKQNIIGNGSPPQNYDRAYNYGKGTQGSMWYATSTSKIER